MHSGVVPLPWQPITPLKTGEFVIVAMVTAVLGAKDNAQKNKFRTDCRYFIIIFIFWKHADRMVIL